MRFSHHTRNNMRRLAVAEHEVRELVTSDAGWISLDERGNIRVTGSIGAHGVRIVIAIDDPGFAITVHEYRGGAW